MNILVMRHEQCESNGLGLLNGTADTKLTELGKRQARISGQKLKDRKISVIYSSPLLRALDTARIVAEEIGFNVNDIKTERLLIERHFGVLTGKPEADIYLYAKDIIVGDRVRYFLDTEGAEHYDAVSIRVQNVLADVLGRYAETDKNILLVTHGAVAQTIRAVYNKQHWRQSFLVSPYIDNGEIMELDGKLLNFGLMVNL